jgi:hypothetical protein
MSIDAAPLVEIGKDFVVTATLSRDGAASDLTDATISAKLVGPTGIELIGATIQSAATDGADWANGIIVIVFPKASTSALLPGDAYVVYDVTSGGMEQGYEPQQLQMVVQAAGVVPQVLTPNERAVCFEIFGVPPGGTGVAYSLISTLFGPAGESYDHSKLVTDLNARLDALPPPHVQRVRQVCTTRWDEIGSTRQVLITKSATGSEGILQDDHAERALIRKRLITITGFWCPKGGFVTEKDGGGRRIIR